MDKVSQGKVTARTRDLRVPNSAVPFSAEYEDLAYRESIWRLALEGSQQGVWDYNRRTEQYYYSDGWKRMRGLDPAAHVEGSLEKWLENVHPDDVEYVHTQILRHHRGDINAFTFEYREKRPDGTWVNILARGRTVEWDEDGKPLRFLGTDLDITRLKQAEANRTYETEKVFRHQVLELKRAHREAETARCEQEKISNVDALSGLANRRAFMAKLEELTAGQSEDFSLFLLDLNHFKEVNDELGHNVGDAVIVEVARRLTEVATKCSLVARLGGDEFGLIIPDAADNPVCETDVLLTNICAALKPQFKLEPHAIAIGGSLGVARFPEHATSVSELMRLADIALYEAKARDRCPFVVYDDGIGQKAARDTMLAHDLRKALHSGEVVPFFQPIVNLRTGEIIRLEALARWNHPTLGRVGPDEFIPISERLRLGEELTACVAGRALDEAAHWPVHISLSLNISADEMCTEGGALKLLQLLRSKNFSPTRLHVEIIEQALLKDLAVASREIQTLRRAGASVYLDDFGKGFSGLHYLRELELDGIKIDGAFSKGLARGNMGWKVLNGLIDLARSMSLATVVEGIEDQGAQDACSKLGAQAGQGYWLGRPMPAKATAELLARVNKTGQVGA